MAHTIAFVSGKGGAGKTAVALSTAQLLNGVGARVALLDLDHATRGLTHYLSASLPGEGYGLAEPGGEGLVQVHVDSGDADNPLVFVPSTENLTIDLPDHTATQNQQLNLNRIFGQLNQSVDFILLDLPAGTADALDLAHQYSDTLVVVTEADPVSIGAVESVRRTLYRMDRRPPRVVGVVNRALPDEEPYFEALVDYMPDMEWVGILPSDPSIRKAFFRRTLPLTAGAGAPFGIALAQALSRIPGPLGMIGQRAGQWVGGNRPPDDDYEKLLRLRSELETSLARATYERERMRFVSTMTSAVLMLAVAVGIAFTLAADFPVYVAVITAGFGGLGSVVTWGYGNLRSRAIDQLERERTRRELDRVERLVDALEVARRSRP